MKIISYASIILASAGSASAATALNQNHCEFFCRHALREGGIAAQCKAPTAPNRVMKDLTRVFARFHVTLRRIAAAKACSASSSPECDANLAAKENELATANAELATAKECKAKSPNYKAPVNDECNPKNCDEWDCGQWCVCYNADHDAIYEVLGCAADDDDETCQC